jgi:hypothetical protein
MSWNEQEEMDNDLLAHHDYAGSPGRLSPHTQALCLSAADQPLPTPNFRHSGIQALPDPPLWYQSPTPLLYCLAKVPRWLATNPRDASGASSGPESQMSQPTRRATIPQPPHERPLGSVPVKWRRSQSKTLRMAGDQAGAMPRSGWQQATLRRPLETSDGE